MSKYVKIFVWFIRSRNVLKYFVFGALDYRIVWNRCNIHILLGLFVCFLLLLLMRMEALGRHITLLPQLGGTSPHLVHPPQVIQLDFEAVGSTQKISVPCSAARFAIQSATLFSSLKTCLISIDQSLDNTFLHSWIIILSSLLPMHPPITTSIASVESDSNTTHLYQLLHANFKPHRIASNSVVQRPI